MLFWIVMLTRRHNRKTNHIPLFIFIYEECDLRADIIVVIDCYAYTTSQQFRQIIAFVARLFRDYGIDSGDVRLALVTHGERVQVHFDLNSHFIATEVFSALSRVPTILGSSNNGSYKKCFLSIVSFFPKRNIVR